MQAFHKVSAELGIWAYTVSIFQIFCRSPSCLQLGEQEHVNTKYTQQEVHIWNFIMNMQQTG